MSDIPFHRNQLLVRLQDETTHRLLFFDIDADDAWLILVGDAAEKALPYCLKYSKLPEGFRPFTPNSHGPPRGITRIQLTTAESLHVDSAWKRIGPLVDLVPDIFYPSLRNKLLKTRESELSAEAKLQAAARLELIELANIPDIELPPLVTGSAKTLLRDLRDYWRGGQTQDALRGRYQNCAHRDKTGTALRGRKTANGLRPFQRTLSDDEAMRDVLENVFLKLNATVTLKDAHEQLKQKHYTYVDGNGEVHLKPGVEAPSYNQFYRFLHRNYPLETIIRRRKGDKVFSTQHRATSGSIQLRTHGVGHIYEFDATIADVVLVSLRNRAHIVGKPTLYLIIDRDSRMIVGWYVGFENASYTPAMLAILSIGEDKEKLCRRLGIKYDPLDWPAHGILPESFVADQGELVHKQARRITRSLRAMITNVPGLRPDMKPLVECGFALLHQIIAPVTIAYSPDSANRARRRAKYDKNAALNINEFESIIVKAIITYNRTMQVEYPLNFQQIEDEVPPSPRELFRHGVRKRMGLLDIIDFDKVRAELLPRESTTIHKDGLTFKRMFYQSAEAERRGWLVEGRIERKPFNFSYDYRLVDEIFVDAPDGSGERLPLQLAGDSVKFKGMSYAEVHRSFQAVDKITAPAKDEKSEARHEFAKHVGPINERALKEMREQTQDESYSSRRKDVPGARAEDLREERIQTAGAFHPGRTPGDRAQSQVVEPPQESAPVGAFPISGVRVQPSAEPRGPNASATAPAGSPPAVDTLLSATPPAPAPALNPSPSDTERPAAQASAVANANGDSPQYEDVPDLLDFEVEGAKAAYEHTQPEDDGDGDPPQHPSTPSPAPQRPMTLRERMAAKRRQNS
ncbi:hypothetical protein [Mitsuaria sp. 7]|uniref:hypothetical protein n=1 Tax=Mitsuaria sp. 7 TaxID=1658665 RepID=UPI0012F816AC|nr:hypothetical protein [Mitsuaria sp. 7]